MVFSACLLLLLCSGIPSGRDKDHMWCGKQNQVACKASTLALNPLFISWQLTNHWDSFLHLSKINLCYSPISYWTITFWQMFKQDSSKELIFKDCWPCKGTKESKILELLFPWTVETVLFSIRYLLGFYFSLPVSLRIFKTFHFQSYNCCWLFLSYDFWS